MTGPLRSYRYLDAITAGFITTLMCANLIGASKVVSVLDFRFGAGVLLFPISYIFGDILTEVYGYAASRRVIWLGFSAMTFTSFVTFVIVALPAADPVQGQAIELVFGQTPRIIGASLLAYFLGDLFNSYVLAKMKVATNGRYLWARTIGSTIIGEGFDSLVFYPLAFLGTWPWDVVRQVMIGNYLIKLGIEVVMTPLTYVVVTKLKKAENEDFYDRGTDFNVFKFD
jgi:queuosine precursor transporter